MVELKKQDLVEYVKDIIVDIRNDKNNSFYELQQKLNKLNDYEKILNNNNDAREILNIYKEIQNISMLLRQLLSRFIDIDVYDKITYAFYYNGERYETDTINEEWISYSKKNGLKINLKRAVDDLSSAYSDEYKKEIKRVFDEHFKYFNAAIEGTYAGGKNNIGKGGALNKGHIAEAYESHTEEHHPMYYKLLNHLLEGEVSEPLPQILYYSEDVDAVNYWAQHESIDQAWQHIRDSLGTQRGTVAGDVFGMQVKSATSNARRLRLARYNTLIDGIKTYSMILNPEVKVEEVANLIASYISEPMSKMSEKIIDNITDDLISDNLRIKNNNIIQGYVRV